MLEFRKCVEKMPFLVADRQLFKRFCPSIRPLVHLLVMVIELKCGKISVFDTVCVCLSDAGGLGCGCNNIVTPCHLFHIKSLLQHRWSIMAMC